MEPSPQPLTLLGRPHAGEAPTARRWWGGAIPAKRHVHRWGLRKPAHYHRAKHGAFSMGSVVDGDPV